MAKVAGRDFSEPELARLFRLLDTGGTRPQVREEIRQLQGRGASNEVLRKLRDVHRTTRRSQGYRVAQGGTRNLRDPETGRLRQLRDLPARKVIPAFNRPAPPANLPADVTVVFDLRDAQGRRTGSQQIASFRVGPGQAPLTDQVRLASQRGGGSNYVQRDRTQIPGGRGFEVLQSRPRI